MKKLTVVFENDGYPVPENQIALSEFIHGLNCGLQLRHAEPVRMESDNPGQCEIIGESAPIEIVEAWIKFIKEASYSTTIFKNESK